MRFSNQGNRRMCSLFRSFHECNKHVHVRIYAHVHSAVSLLLVERYDLTPETGLSVTVRVNPLCPNAVYPVLASFGTQKTDGSTDCNMQQNDADAIRPGESITLTADPDNVTLEVGQKYCIVVSSDEEIFFGM